MNDATSVVREVTLPGTVTGEEDRQVVTGAPSVTQDPCLGLGLAAPVDAFLEAHLGTGVTAVAAAGVVRGHKESEDLLGAALKQKPGITLYSKSQMWEICICK